jgi:hypothetical protein
MATSFKDLSEQEKINAVKDNFTKIMTQLAESKEALKQYVTEPEALRTISDTMSDTEKADAIKHNEAAEKQRVALKEIEEIISKTERTEGCICGMCVKVSFSNNMIPPVLEPLIEAAQKNAEKETY